MGFWDFVGKRKIKLEHSLSEKDREIIEAMHFQTTILYDELESFRSQLDEAMNACERMAEILVSLYGEGKSGLQAGKSGAHRPTHDPSNPGTGERKMRV